MSLVGFKARNHPQQVGRRGARPEIDDRATAPEVFAPIHERFGFTIDVAALPHNTKCERFLTPEDDGLATSWAGERAWCNPPFSNIEPWIEKANAEWDKSFDYGVFTGEGPRLIVMIVPNRTEQGWWHRHVEPYRDSSHGGRGPRRVEFLQGRTRFIAHDDTEVQPDARPPYACALLIWHATGECPPRVAIPTGAVGRRPPSPTATSLDLPHAGGQPVSPGKAEVESTQTRSHPTSEPS